MAAALRLGARAAIVVLASMAVQDSRLVVDRSGLLPDGLLQFIHGFTCQPLSASRFGLASAQNHRNHAAHGHAANNGQHTGDHPQNHQQKHQQQSSKSGEPLNMTLYNAYRALVDSRVERYPSLYTASNVGEEPALLFADVILGDECFTFTSRYHSDGRTNFDFEKMIVSYRSAEQQSYAVLFNRTVYKSNAIGVDTPVLQMRFCDPELRNMMETKLQIQYDGDPIKYYDIKRLNLPRVDAAACSMSTIEDLWSARTWIEHHRNVGVGRCAPFHSPNLVI
jgi:hypothetical protein